MDDSAFSRDHSYIDDAAQQDVLVSLFHRVTHTVVSDPVQTPTWSGIPIDASPYDLWIYQELIARIRPDVIIETGKDEGGHSVYLGSLCDLIDHGRVVSIAETKTSQYDHPRITYVQGSSIEPTLESYLIVCGTDRVGHRIRSDDGHGSSEAVDRFLSSTSEFVADRDCEKFSGDIQSGRLSQKGWPFMTDEPTGRTSKEQPGGDSQSGGVLIPGMTPDIVKQISNGINHLYYARSSTTWQNTTWMGIDVRKYPTDLWMYQEILHFVRPDLIIETGTFQGGSALYYAGLCDLMGRGRIISVDVDDWNPPKHDRITYLTGSSIDPEIAEHVIAGANEQDATVLVVLDSNHRAEHVSEELRLYAPLVTVGSYLVVEDTMVNGNPVEPNFGPGPMEALDAFLATTDQFVVDERFTRYLLTCNPRGFLRRVAGPA